MGVTGLNRPVYWGVYITNFVFFIGLAHSGTFISAILRLAGAEWRKPLTRAAEAITIFSLPFGVSSILIDMGRPERALNVIFYGRFQSPLLWDFTAVSLYMFSSVVFFYLSLLPDIALCRDRLTDAPAWQQWMYRLLALGWQGESATISSSGARAGWDGDFHDDARRHRSYGCIVGVWHDGSTRLALCRSLVRSFCWAQFSPARRQ